MPRIAAFLFAVPHWLLALLALVAAGAAGAALGRGGIAALVAHWPLLLLAALPVLGMAGLLGRGLGLQNIFHEDPELLARHGARLGWRVLRHSPAFLAQAAISGALVYLLGFAFLIDLAPGAGIAPRAPGIGAAVAAGSLLALLCGVLRITRAVGPLQPGERWRCALGTLAGLGYAWAMLWLAIRVEAALPEGWTARPVLALMLPGLLSAVAVLYYRKLLPAVSLVSLVTLAAILYAGLASLGAVGQTLAVAAILALLALSGGLAARLAGREAPLRFRIPGIVDRDGAEHYAPGRLLDLEAIYHAREAEAEGVAARLDSMEAFRRQMEAEAPAAQLADRAGIARETARGRLDPLETLDAWRARVPGRPTEPPRAPDLSAVPLADAETVARALDEIRAMAGDVPAGGLVPPTLGLDAPPMAPAMPDRRPKLVIVATSGGAYRAAFWTGLVLDTLAGLDRAGVLPGFAANLRLVTGASGGMVGGAYFAALADPSGRQKGLVCATLERDILAVQTAGAPEAAGYPCTTTAPIPRDSLSAVAQQLVQRDLPGLLLPGARPVDRGTVLEDQWASLDIPFADLAPGEAEGWRPSLILSPMLVETGQPLLVSNLDMDLVRRDKHGETVQFFDWFPASRASFRVKTAVRLNAAFPYVSPAAALPTRPYRRVVDAGYYDNYGVDLAATYLARPEIRDWILEHCSGVVVLQLRAFPFARPSVEQPGALRRGLQWLTTPLEGVLAARGSTMTFRNRQSLRQVRNDYAAATGHADFVASVSFEVDSDTSLSWYLPGRELEAMREGLRHLLNQRALADLLRTWWR